MTDNVCKSTLIGKVMLATDGSEFSAGAVREAVALAKGAKASLVALMVVEFNPEFEAMAPATQEKFEAQAVAAVGAVCTEAAKEGVACEAVALRHSSPWMAIVEEAENRGCNLIVMGRHGRRGLVRLMLGSVTARVIGHSPINVLVAPKDARSGSAVMIATDGSAYSDKAACEGIEIAKSLGVPVIVASVAEGDEKNAQTYVDKIANSAKHLGVSAEGMVVHGRPHEAIVNAAKDKHAGLIVMGSYGKTGLERLLMGSVTERVIGHADCSVFVAASGTYQSRYIKK